MSTGRYRQFRAAAPFGTGVGTLIDLERHRAARAARTTHRMRSSAPVRAVVCFDLASADTYLLAEQAERLFGDVRWCPASTPALHRRRAPDERGTVVARAAVLRLPLVWPEGPPGPVPAAMRAASLAVERGRGAQFVLAASRLAFCGGFDLDDPEILAEASAAAGVELDAALGAAGDAGRDGAIERTGRWLLAAGAERLPVTLLGGRMFCGEERLADAARAAHRLVAAR